MKEKFLLYITILLLSFTTYPTQAEKVLLSYFELPPHITRNVDTNDAEGVLVDFLTTIIAPKMKVDFIFEFMPLKRTINELTNGDIDGTAILAYTPKRASSFIQYPANNFSEMRSVIIVKKNSSLHSIKTTDDIKDMKIGSFLGAIQTPFIKKAPVLWANISGKNPTQRNLNKLLMERIDGVYLPLEVVAVQEAYNLNIMDDIKILQLPEKPFKVFTVWGGDKGQLKERYDDVMEEIDGYSIYKRMLQSSISLNENQQTKANLIKNKEK